ncbi:BBP7 family outer membrane beta-barrel protein [Bythopirellula goksoeyrii]|uniref:Uncharacterized protein n=1 Tax=Bythopirellula goksoeyrii TaxID=1400387 RepID=A0A5B9Q5H1_9BACT|nr:BBP7 family outer membrane beta-barrel protein [Bythopirellula goksoeyrii]QEG32980.1 hypothetical protein Pr1d_02410 [Bythopirellula goksoeyrii]
MTAPKIFNWVATSLLITMSSVVSQAQPLHHELVLEGPNPTPLLMDNPNHDLQFFAPVDFDFECRPIRQQCGYFFSFEKSFWAATGERVTVGDPNEVVFSELIFGGNLSPFSIGTPPPQYIINNSIQDAPPNGRDFGHGDRYEFGYTQGGNGWMIGVMDGPEIAGRQIFGFNSLTIPNQLPLIENLHDPNFDFPNFVFGSNIFGEPGSGSFDIATSRNGFGSVHVNFRTPDGFLTGFVDYAINGPNNELGPTVAGPGRAVQAVVVGTGIDGNPEVLLVDLTSGADGLPDNLNGNIVGGFFFVVNADDEVIGTGVDYEDLHTFNVAFERFEVRNLTETDGIELMKTVTLDNRHLPVKRQGEFVELGVGVRYLRLNDVFYFNGSGGILGRTYATTGAENQIVGPQVRGRWSKQRGRWNFGLDGRFMFGYNVQDQTQIGAIGEDLSPGAVNSPIYAQPHAVSYARQQQNFSPVAEIRADCSYQITSSIAAKLGYTGIFVENITRASQTVDWYIPDLGILKGGNNEIYVNGVDFGFEAVY